MDVERADDLPFRVEHQQRVDLVRFHQLRGFRGQLDASRKQAAAPDVRRDLFEAMQQIAETGVGPEVQYPSIGCSIKWKEEA